MDMSGSYRITAPREKVWAALNDPEILKQCIPGCEEIEKHSDTELTAKVVAKVGPVKAKFAGKVTLSDIDPPNGYTITGEGSGGAAGFGKGGAAVKLNPDGDDATLLDYTAHAQVGGKLAQIGSRLIDGTARKMADDFFAKFTQVVGQPQNEADGEAEAPMPQEAPAPGGQLAAQPAAMAAMAFSPAAPAASRPESGDSPVDMRLVAMVGAATAAFVAILFLVAGG
jgi:carbon monoxide dehydrogenase subunit G